MKLRFTSGAAAPPLKVTVTADDWPIIPMPGHNCTEAWRVPPDVRDAFTAELARADQIPGYDGSQLRRLLDARCTLLASVPD